MIPPWYKWGFLFSKAQQGRTHARPRLRGLDIDASIIFMQVAIIIFKSDIPLKMGLLLSGEIQTSLSL